MSWIIYRTLPGAVQYRQTSTHKKNDQHATSNKQQTNNQTAPKWMENNQIVEVGLDEDNKIDRDSRQKSVSEGDDH